METARAMAVVGLCWLCSCSSTRDPGTCLNVTMPEGSLMTTPPSKISLFFTVDTCGGDPVTGLTTGDFQLLEDARPVSSYESRLTIQAKGQRFRMYSLVLLD